MHLRAATALLATGLATSLALSGCAVGAGDDDSSSGSHDHEVVLMTHDSFALPKKLLAQFTRKTGYRVDVRKSGDAGELASKLTLSAGNPEGDVAYGIDNTFASRVLNADVFDPYTPSKLPAGAGRYDVAGDGGRHLTPVDNAGVCVNVDKTWFAKRGLPAPRGLDDLTKPAYKNLLAIPGATTSSPGLAFLLATIAAKGDHWQAYWHDLMANGAEVVDSWNQAYNVEFTQGGGHGTRPIVVSYDSDPAYTVEHGVTSTKALLGTCFGQVEYAGVLRGADNTAGARAFVDFLESPQVQKSLPTSMYVYPVAAKTPLPKTWASFAKKPARTLQVDPADIEKNREEWLQQWSDIISK